MTDNDSWKDHPSLQRKKSSREQSQNFLQTTIGSKKGNPGGFINNRSIEKLELFQRLESYLVKNVDNEGLKEIVEIYELTKTYSTKEAYFQLLQKLEKSTFVFPGFVIQNTKRSDFPLQVQFISQENQKVDFERRRSINHHTCITYSQLDNFPNNKSSNVSTNFDEKNDASFDVEIREIQKKVSINTDCNDADNIQLSHILVEREKVLEKLETFFHTDGNDFRYDALHDMYEIAFETRSKEVYSMLLDKLYSSRISFPGFNLKRASDASGNPISVVFDDNTKDQHSSKELLPFLSHTKDTPDSSSKTLIESNELLHKKYEQAHSVDESTGCDNQLSRKNEVPSEKNELTDKFSESIRRYEEHIKTQDDQIELLRADFNRLVSHTNHKDSDELEAEDYLDNVKDSFSFIMVNQWSIPALSSYFIFLVQMVSFFLAVSESILEPQESEFQTAPPLNIPKAATIFVHVTQVITLFLLIIVQDSLWESVADLFNGYNDHLKFQGINFVWWLIPNLLRLTGGVVALIVTFVLVVESDNVVELLKDFTAMLFISSFDNMIYFLAGLNVIGRTFKKEFDAVEKITYKITEQNLDPLQTDLSAATLKKGIMHPSVIGIFFMFLLFGIWFNYVFLSHIQFKYLCQDIFIQLDDDVNPKLSFFSGSYKIVKKGIRLVNYPAYKESKRSLKESTNISLPSKNAAKAMILQYCSNSNSWIFVEETDYNDGNCNEVKSYAKSEMVTGQTRFNVFEIPTDNWFVKYRDGRWMPLKDFHITCQDREHKYSEKVEVENENVCVKMEVDESKVPFQSSRLWASTFFLHNITVYDHPVYWADAPTPYTGKDLILFLGKRWIITSSNHLKNFNKTGGDLTSYLQEEFHAYWSNFEVEFFSERVLVDTPQDTPSPVGLFWFKSTPKSNKTQRADEKSDVKSILICSHCSDSSNPCLYEGICSKENKTCHCKNGSTGTLCQMLPTKNGFCNEFFNVREFGFDEGDCCAHSCVSSDMNACGIDKSGQFYIGYDKCKNDDIVDTVWFQTEQSPNLKQIIVAYIKLSENGRILALIDSVTESVRVYDSEGSRWIMRGTAVTTVVSPAFASLSISGDFFAFKNREILPPVTIAVMSTSIFEVYEWSLGFWKKIMNGISNESLSLVTQIELCDVGKILGILYKNESFQMFERFQNPNLWLEIKSATEKKNFTYLSMAENGVKFVLANEKHVELRNRSNEIMVTKTFNKRIRNVKISPNGETLIVLEGETFTQMSINRYSISDNNFSQIGGELRGISMDASLDISNDGNEIITHSPTYSTIKVYKWIQESWQKVGEELFCKSMSLSSDKSSLAVVTSRQSVKMVPSDSAIVYHRYFPCDGARIQISFVPDDFPSELSWEISTIRSGNIVSLKKGGPYIAEGVMTVEDLCVEDEHHHEKCIIISIFDLGMDGLKSPGRLGISRNGEIIFNLFSSNGYKKSYVAYGDNACLDNQSNPNPWGENFNSSIYNSCLSLGCKWNKTGSVIHGHSVDYQYISASISSDGLVFAVGNSEANNSTGQVQVYLYNGYKGWIEHGPEKFGEHEGDRFGSSVSLSADGFSLAIGASYASTNGTKSGQVRIYIYDAKNKVWSQRGNDINGISSEASLGSYISLSANGEIIAISQKGICQAIVFKYYAKNDKWTQFGCMEGNILPPTGVTLSSNGMVLAVSNPFANNTQGHVQSGVVRIFEYNSFTEKWSSRGNNFEGLGIYHSLGYSVSMSSDGTTLAISGGAYYPIFIFKYNEDEKIYQAKGESGGIKVEGNGALGIALSSLGNVIIAAHGPFLSTYLYDSDIKAWLPLPDPFNISDVNYDFARTFVSADAVTIVGKTKSSYETYRLSLLPKVSTCEGNDFNFTITPDGFPEDIEWELLNEFGKKEFSATLRSNDVDDWQISLNTLNYIKCFSNGMIYTFIIKDTYGDGICCDWGDGGFSLEWNNQVVLKSDGFKDLSHVCLAETSDHSFLTIAADFSNTSQKKLRLVGMDSSSQSHVFEKIIEHNTREQGNQTFQLCIPDIVGCVQFISEEQTGNGIPFYISLDQALLYQNTKSYFIDKTSYGKNCSVQYCAQEEQMFELDFFTHRFAEENFSWELVDSKNKTLKEGKTYEKLDSHYFIRDCFLVPANECLVLRLTDECPPECGGITYRLSWNGDFIDSGNVSYNTTNIEIVPKGMSC